MSKLLVVYTTISYIVIWFFSVICVTDEEVSPITVYKYLFWPIIILQKLIILLLWSIHEIFLPIFSALIFVKYEDTLLYRFIGYVLNKEELK